MLSHAKSYTAGGYFRVLACFLVCLLGLSPANAVITFEKWFGGTDSDYGTSVVQTTDGGYTITGITYSYGAGIDDVYLIKTDSVGDTLWTRTFGGSDLDYGRSGVQTTDGGYIVTGGTTSYGAGDHDVYLIKTDSNGDTLWTRTFGGFDLDWSSSVAQSSDLGYIITGATYSYGAGFDDVYLIKTDSNGDALWTRTFGGTGSEYGTSVCQTTDEGYIITGGTASYGASDHDVYLIKTDSVGDTLWTRTFGGIDYDYGTSVVQTTDGGYVITGGTQSYGAGSGDVYLIKTDSNGDTLWTRTFGGIYNDWGSSVTQCSDLGYIITSRTESYGAGSYDVYLIKTDSTGDTLWTRTFGGINDDWGSSVAQCSDLGYIVTGWTESYGAGSYDVYLIKTDSLGNVGVEEKGVDSAKHSNFIVTIFRQEQDLPRVRHHRTRCGT